MPDICGSPNDAFATHFAAVGAVPDRMFTAPNRTSLGRIIAGSSHSLRVGEVLRAAIEWTREAKRMVLGERRDDTKRAAGANCAGVAAAHTSAVLRDEIAARKR